MDKRHSEVSPWEDEPDQNKEIDGLPNAQPLKNIIF